jgi:hypothetical protein
MELMGLCGMTGEKVLGRMVEESLSWVCPPFQYREGCLAYVPGREEHLLL